MEGTTPEEQAMELAFEMLASDNPYGGGGGRVNRAKKKKRGAMDFTQESPRSAAIQQAWELRSGGR